MKKMERKKLSDTKREIVIGKDKCRKCKELLEWSRVYPFDVYCPMCHKGMEYEDEIIFHKKSPMKNDAKNHNKPIQGKDFEEWVEEKTRLIVENLYMYKKDKKPHYIPGLDEQKHYKIKLDIAEDFIRQIAKELKPRVSREEWMKYSKEMDGEYTPDYYLGADRVFEWLEILGVEGEK